MRIKMLTTMAGPDRSPVNAGQETDVADEEGSELIAGGFAVAVKVQGQAADGDDDVEESTASADEDATAAPQRRRR